MLLFALQHPFEIEDEVKGVSYFKVAGVKIITPPVHFYLCKKKTCLGMSTYVSVYEGLWRCTSRYHASCCVLGYHVIHFKVKTVKTSAGNCRRKCKCLGQVIDRQAVWGSIDRLWMHDRGTLIKKKNSVAQLAETQENVARGGIVVLRSSTKPNIL